MKRYWWIIAIAIFIIGLPVLLNFLVFKPVSQLSVGTLQDWMSFWGSYLSATISALIAFVILVIQRKDTKHNYEQTRRDNRRQYSFNKRVTGWDDTVKTDKEKEEARHYQRNLFLYQQEIQWLNVLREALVKYISAFQENEIWEIINSIPVSSFESIQQKIKAVYKTLNQADTTLNLVISENRKTTINNTYQKKLADIYACYISVVNDIQLLACLYYNNSPIFNKASDSLNNLITEMGIDSNNMDYNQFLELAQRITKPLSDIVEMVRTLSYSCIKDERQRIDSILNGGNDVKRNLEYCV